MTTASSPFRKKCPPQAQPRANDELPGTHAAAIAAIDHAVAAVQSRIAPVWPLQDYVAVNPLLGYAGQKFLSARHTLRSVSDIELLMSGDYYRHEFEEGAFSKEDISTAIDELVADGVVGAERLDLNQILVFLQGPRGPFPAADAEFPLASHRRRPLRTFATILDEHTRSDWSRRIREEIAKHCATHYDQGQAVWRSGWQGLPLYQAWRSAAQLDRSFEALGVCRFRSFVATLPHHPQAALVLLLQQLGVPQHLWADFLLCESLTMPGWAAWTKYQHRKASQHGEESTDLAGLLAIRLAYEVALARHLNFHVHWDSIARHHNSLLDDTQHPSVDDTNVDAVDTNVDLVRYALLRTCEIAFRRRLLADLEHAKRPSQPGCPARALAQMVFCIDVRSERIRRQLETVSSDIETFGFAGFFGLPIEFIGVGESAGSSQVPVLISPRFKVYEALDTTDDEGQLATVKQRAVWRFLRSTWKGFQASAVSTFAFAETIGLLYGTKLIARTLGLDSDWPSRFDGVPKAERERLGPSLHGLPQQGVGTIQQVELAESVLRGIGIVNNFARLVVFCGHGSQTVNNPLKSGLDCGACGGHSGEPNARLAAKLLNQQPVRQALAKRGITIPGDTQFVAALHNTTTDRLQFFDTHQLPSSHRADLQQLQNHAEHASKHTAHERLACLPGPGVEDLVRRSLDWSEVRPEWGLAGNAAFIAAPRDLTEGVPLDGRAFLHSYDHTRDKDFAVLEQILTAPLVVANWINLQYYASTVDPVHFSSGNKTVHNVVGQFGIFSGNGGDLMTGLPWQSIHDGTRYRHHPLRLLAVIAAPRAAIEAILEKHLHVADLLVNGWMQLLAIEGGSYFRYSEQQQWEELTFKTAQGSTTTSDILATTGSEPNKR